MPADPRWTVDTETRLKMADVLTAYTLAEPGPLFNDEAYDLTGPLLDVLADAGLLGGKLQYGLRIVYPTGVEDWEMPEGLRREELDETAAYNNAHGSATTVIQRATGPWTPVEVPNAG